MLGGLKRRWVVSCLGITVAILIATVLIFTLTVRVSYYNNVSNQLLTRADSTARLFRNYINTTSREFYSGAANFAETFAEKDRLEFEVIDLEGRVIYSSSFSRLTGYIPGTPDVQNAIANEKSSSYSGLDSITGQKVISASAPVYLSGGELVGAVRYVTGVELIKGRIWTLASVASVVASGAVLLVVVSGVYFMTSIINPINRINTAANTIAAGNYGETISYRRNDEIGELVRAVNFMSREIKRSTDIKNDFISSVSHELRTPLTVISGWAETLLATEKDPNSVQARGLETIQSESRRLGSLVEELLDFSRIESGRMELSNVVFDLNAELEDIIFMMEQRISADGIHIVYTDATEDALVSGDPKRIRQVFVNLMDNARKFSQPGSTIDISIAEAAVGGFVEVKVADHGCGISEADLPHVKEKFYKGRSDRAGSGIGLAISDEIISLHGGKLTIESREGQGTCVTVRLKME